MTSLTDRYVDAAMRTVPEKQRADLATELRASIDDQIEARLMEGTAPAEAERAVLTELGDPDRLAAAYIERPLWLIGPRYYLTWWRLTTLLWAIVPACVAFVVALAQVLAGAGVGATIGAVVPSVLSVIVHIGFWTALVFFILERAVPDADAGMVGQWSVDRLPEKKERGATVSDLVANLVFLGLLAGALVWDRFFGFVYVADEGWTSFLAADLWPWWAAAFFVLIGAAGALAIWVYARGRWTYGAATVNLALSALTTGVLVWLLTQGRLVDPELFTRIIPNDGEAVGTIAGVVFVFATVGVAAWGVVDAFFKARRSRPAAPARAALG